MKLKFDATLDYQLEAIQSVTDLFEGLSAQETLFSTDFGKIDGGLYNELGKVEKQIAQMEDEAQAAVFSSTVKQIKQAYRQ